MKKVLNAAQLPITSLVTKLMGCFHHLEQVRFHTGSPRIAFLLPWEVACTRPFYQVENLSFQHETIPTFAAFVTCACKVSTSPVSF